MSNQGPGADPGQVDGASSDGDHTSMFWKDEGDVNHRVSFDDGGKNEHYVQTDSEGTKLIYDYNSGQWIDKSK